LLVALRAGAVRVWFAGLYPVDLAVKKGQGCIQCLFALLELWKEHPRMIP
jgi:hypothetical protein